MTSLPRAAIYCRVSSDQQEDNYSLPTQEAACRQYCAERGYEVAGIFTDVHTGAQYRERPELSRLRELVRQKAIDVVVCYAVDRLSRNQAHLYILAEEMSDHGVRLEFVTEKFEDTAVGRFILAAKSFAAEIEREKIIERTTRGTHARIRSGKPKPSCAPPYGYRWANADKSRLDPDPATAPIVVRIFRSLAEGSSLRAIARRLTEDGIPTPRGNAVWAPASVYKIVCNPVYTGRMVGLRTVTVRVNGKKVLRQRDPSEWVELPGVAPALVSEELWQAAHQRLVANRWDSPRHNPAPEVGLLRGGFARCGACGRTLIVSRIPKRGIAEYRCYGRSDCPSCATIAVDKLDQAVRDWITETLSRREVIEQAIASLDDAPLANELQLIERQLQQLERQQGNLVAALADTDNEDVRRMLLSQVQQVSDRLAVLRRERDQVRAVATQHERQRSALRQFIGQAEELAKRFASLPYQKQRDALRALRLSVIVTRRERWRPPEVEIRVALPIEQHHCVNNCR
jgi:site-specific DNA recombinase